MYRRGWAVVLLALSSAIPAQAAEWGQLGGSASRAGTVILPDFPLDIVNTFDFVDDGFVLLNWDTAGLVETPHGLAGFVVSDTSLHQGDCHRILMTDIVRGDPVSGEPGFCEGLSSTAAYDRLHDRLLNCRTASGGGPVLSAVDARTNVTAWEVDPYVDLGVPPAAPVFVEFWGCTGLAVDYDAGEVAASFRTTSLPTFRHRIALLNLANGTAKWSVEVPASVFARPGSDASVERNNGFIPFVVTRTDSGYVVTGIFGPFVASGATGNERAEVITSAVAWLDTNGNVVGAQLPGNDPAVLVTNQAGQSSLAGSVWAAASGSHSALGLGNELVVIDPRRPTATSVPLDAGEDDRGASSWAAPTWRGRDIIVPLKHSLLRFDYNPSVDSIVQKNTSWTGLGVNGLEDWSVWDSFISAPDDVYVVATHNATQGQETFLFRLSLLRDAVLQRWPIPLEPRYQETSTGGSASVRDVRWLLRLMPMEDRGALLLWDTDGRAVSFGQANAALIPAARVQNPYPRVREPVVLELTAGRAQDVREFVVSWGEGPPVTWSLAANPQHAYPGAGPRTIRVMAVYNDGRTGTLELPVWVGGAPPEADAAQGPGLLAAVRSSFWWLLFLLVPGGLGLIVLRQRRRRAAPAALSLESRTRFEIERELARGATGRALLARDRVLDRRVVLKAPLAPLMADQKVRNHYLKEARLLARLHHPNVVAVHEILTDNDPPVLVLEYVEGGGLDQFVKNNGKLGPDEAVRIVLDVLAGLGAIHSAGIVHRDIKPANILIAQDGRAKVADLGIAHPPAGFDMTATNVEGGDRAGSLLFMAPEQIRGAGVGAATDLYAAGVLFYHMMTGGHYLGPTPRSDERVRQSILRENPRLPHPDVPAAFEEVLSTALQKDPARRFTTAEEMAEAVQRARDRARNP